MIKLVAADRGEGKTTKLIELANSQLKNVKGHIVFIDQNESHIYALKHEIRYINISDFPIDVSSEFFGFICGILSRDNDIEIIYVDGLLKQAHIDNISNSTDLIEKLRKITDKYEVRFVFSANCEKKNLPESLKEYLLEE